VPEHEDDQASGGDLSGLLGAVLVLYADRALGPTGVREVMDRVGSETVVALVENWEEWVELEVVLATAIAVAELCHEPDIGRRTGEELFRVLQERGLLVLPTHVSLVDAFADIVASLDTATDLRHGEVVECEEGFARIEVTSTSDAGASRFLCRMLLGAYASIPNLRQANGAAVETKCVHRGHKLCEFQVRWRAPVTAGAGNDPWADRIQRLQQWAVGLASESADHAPEALQAAVLLEEIRRTAMRDALTGVANRAALELRVQEELERRGTLDWLTMLFVDLDGFKGINDKWGHAAGDDLLKQLSLRLQGAIRTSDLVARLGGDEFVVLFPEIREDELVERLVKKVFAVFDDPYLVDTELHWLKGSIGIARAPDHGTTFAELLHHADHAMYRVKRAKKGLEHVTFWSE
jgi:diguanylate cyclase (GGDEF)-like protein